MTVKLDLRPDKLDESGERAVKAANVLLFFSVCIFLASFVFFLGVSGAALYRVKNAGSFAAADKKYEARIAAAESELRALALHNARTAEDLDFVFGGLPAVEFLDGLSVCLSDEIALESIELTPRGALIKGLAQSDGSVLAFAESLAHQPSVGSVGVPAITSSDGGTLKRFSLDLKLRDIRSVLLSSDAGRTLLCAGWVYA